MVQNSSDCLENKGNNYLVKVDEVPLPICNLTCSEFPLNLSKIEYAPPEITVANYLSSKYKYVFKTENIFWWALQSLLYFEEIFSNVDYDSNDDFYRINGMPRDFFSETFYERRKHFFENKTFYLKHSNIEKELSSRFHEYQNLNIRHLIKEQITFDGLSLIVKCIPTEKVLSIIDHINLNVGLYRKGLPDLFACDEKGNFKLVEVKKKNEKISQFQRHWHKFLVSIDVPVQIIRVGNFLKIYNAISPTGQNSKQCVPDIESFYKPNLVNNVDIKFDKSKSKKFNDLLFLITPYKHIVARRENGEDTYSVKVPLTDIETLINIYDIGGKWKSFIMKINDQTISKSDLVYHGLGCYRKRKQAKDKTLYCFGENYYDCNFLGCKRMGMTFSAVGKNWLQKGYIDKNGTWFFNFEAIRQDLISELQKYKLCPKLDPQKIIEILKLIPKKVNPKTNKNWEYLYDYKLENYSGKNDGNKIIIGVSPTMDYVKDILSKIDANPNWNLELLKPPEALEISISIPDHFEDRILKLIENNVNKITNKIQKPQGVSNENLNVKKPWWKRWFKTNEPED